MSDNSSREKLYSAFFGDADPPSYLRVPSLFNFGVGLSNNTDLRKQVLHEYAKRHQEHGLSELIELRDHLSELHHELKQRGEKPWEESKELEKKVSGVRDPKSGEWVKEPDATEEEEEKFRKLQDKGASLLSKAEVVLYRLRILKIYLWENSVKGKRLYSKDLDESDKLEEDVNELIVKRKAMMCALSDITDIEALKGKEEACEKIVEYGISNDIGDKADPGSIRRYMTENVEYFPSDTLDLKKEINKWKNESEVSAVYKKIKKVREGV